MRKGMQELPVENFGQGHDGHRRNEDGPVAQGFGVLQNGESVGRAVVGADRITASIITRGAAVQDLRIAGVDPSVVLDFPTLDGYTESLSCLGATVGRYANRTSYGQVRIEGRLIHLDLQGNPANGPGTGHRQDSDRHCRAGWIDAIRISLVSPAGAGRNSVSP